MSDLSFIGFAPFTVVIDPIGPVQPTYARLDQALDIARQLEQTGIHIHSIESDTEILEGRELRAALGTLSEPRPLFD
jgi:hypothetical protein